MVTFEGIALRQEHKLQSPFGSAETRVLVSPHSAIRWQAIQKRFDEVGTPAPGANKRPFVANRSEQSEVPERLLNRCNLFRRARILVVGRPGCSETEQLLAMCDPGTLGHKAMLARNPFLDLLIRGTLTSGLLVMWRT